MNRLVKILVITDFDSRYSRDLLKGIVRYSQTVGGWAFYRMPILNRIVHEGEEIAEWVSKWGIDAVVVLMNYGDVKRIPELGIPSVVQNYRNRISGACNIRGAYRETGSMAADYFINLGYRHFAFYGNQHSVWSNERFAGYRDRLTAKGFPLVHHYLESSDIKEIRTQDLDAVGRWLKNLPHEIALLACDDRYALHISETCRINDIAVPDDIAILGVNNDELICNISTPSLSSILIDTENAGYAAGEALHEMLNGNLSEPIDIIAPPSQVISRGSTQKYIIKDKQVMRVVEFIETNYSRPLTVPKLLDLVPVSRRVFEKRFKEHTGMPIYQFLQTYRVERLAGLLTTSDRPIEELAHACGFAGHKNISRIFVRYTGITPSEFRNQFHSGKNRKDMERQWPRQTCSE